VKKKHWGHPSQDILPMELISILKKYHRKYPPPSIGSRNIKVDENGIFLVSVGFGSGQAWEENYKIVCITPFFKGVQTSVQNLTH